MIKSHIFLKNIYYIYLLIFVIISLPAKEIETENLDNLQFITYKNLKLKNFVIPQSILFINKSDAVIQTKRNKLIVVDARNFSYKKTIGNNINKQAPGGYGYIISIFKDESNLYVFDNTRNLNVFSINDNYSFSKRINLSKYTKGYPQAIDKKGNLYCSLYTNPQHSIEKVNLKTQQKTFIGKKNTLNNKKFFFHYSQIYIYILGNNLYCCQSYFPYIEEYDLNGFLIKKITDYSTHFKYANLNISHVDDNFIEKVTASGYSNEWIAKLSKNTLICSISYKLDSSGNHISLLHFYDASGTLIGYLKKKWQYLGSDNLEKLVFFDESNEEYIIGTVF